MDFINNNFQQISDNGEIIVYETDYEKISCNNEWISQQLTSCSNPPSYAELLASAIAKQGWQRVFDQWKEKGIIV